ncbi:hypothetical protein Taro_018155 [Colocasia esculenta]|uniref:Uncharacterized protein n=1 Tax=Colocasia esculenta TaxID=4460 RepID=A0A843V1M6_COLES|nr:hypothetical protein [Colocasia esculenta]
MLTKISLLPGIQDHVQNLVKVTNLVSLIHWPAGRQGWSNVRPANGGGFPPRKVQLGRACAMRQPSGTKATSYTETKEMERGSLPYQKNWFKKEI